MDERLLPVVAVPLDDRAEAVRLTREAIEAGAAAVQIGQYCPPHALAEPHRTRRGVGAVCGSRSGRRHPRGRRRWTTSCRSEYFENGLPPVPDFHGGDTNFKSIDYLSIPYPVMQTLNALDHRRGAACATPISASGCIEVGASWVPGFMRMLDSRARRRSRKNEDRLKSMDL